MLAAVLVGTALVGGGSKPASDTALSTGAPRQVPSLESASPSPPPGGVSGGDLGDVGDVATLKALVSPSLAVAGDRGTAGTVSPAGLAAASPSPSGLRVVGTRVCEVEARTARPQLGLVAYAANVRFQDTDAVVLGFGDGVGAPPITLLVLAPGQSCRVLAESTIP